MVVLGTFQDCREILETAARLAAHQNAELTALFVEDINLIRFAGLPFAREIDVISLNEQQFDLLKMTTALEKQVQQIRRLLAQVKEQSKHPVSLKVVRGHYFAEAISAAADVELLLLNQRGSRLLAKTDLHRRSREKIRPVWVVFDESPAAARSLVLGVELMQSHHAELNIVLKVHSEENIAALKEQVHQFVAGSDKKVHFYVGMKDDLSAILPFILQRGCSILIMSKDDSGPSQQMVSLISEKGGCPVLLVS